MGAHPDGTGTGWTLTETIDVDQPHGLDYRALTHLAKAVRKRNDKEHQPYGDNTAGGEHVPGWCKVLRHVDGTADVSGAADATLFQYNGIVHSVGNETLWCVTGAAGDPTVLLLDPDKQCKGADITWTGAQEFDASVDMTGPLHVDGSTELATTEIDGTLDVLDRADFSSASFSGDVTFGQAVQIDGTLSVNGVSRIIGDCTVYGLMSFCANNLYDSSWFDIVKGTSSVKTHDLSSTALLTTLFFKDTANQTGAGANRIYVVTDWYFVDTGTCYRLGGQVQNVTTTQLTVVTGADAIYSCFSTGAGVPTACTSGQYRIVAMRLV